MDIREVYSAYASIYESKVEEENIHEEYLDEDLEFVDDLTEEELDSLTEEIVLQCFEEGLDIDQLDEIFTEYLEEAKVTYGHDSDSGDDDLVSAVKKKKEEASKKRQKRIEDVKKSIKKGVANVKKVASDLKSGETEKNIKRWAMKPATKYAGDRGLVKLPDKKDKDGITKRQDDKQGIQKKYTYADLQSRQAKSTYKRKTKPEKAKAARKEIRKAIVGDLKSRAQVAAYNLKRNLKRDIETKKTVAKSNIKGFVKKATAAPRKAVKAVRNKTASALSSLADKIKTEGIELDAFDTVVAYLIDEGFATDFDHAQKIMTTLDNQLIEEVHQQQLEFVEAYLVTNADKKGNTPAWQGYKKGKKNVKTGEPLYKGADHLKDEKK